MEKSHESAETGLTKQIFSEPVLSWRVHLLKEHPKKVLLAVPVVSFGLLVSYLLFRNPIPMIAVSFLFLSSLSDYLFPIRYEINEKGASARTILGRTFVEWDRVKKCYLDDTGVKLSTLGHKSRLEAYRGVYLRFGPHKDKVIEAVRRMRNGSRSDVL